MSKICWPFCAPQRLCRKARSDIDKSLYVFLRRSRKAKADIHWLFCMKKRYDRRYYPLSLNLYFQVKGYAGSPCMMTAMRCKNPSQIREVHDWKRLSNVKAMVDSVTTHSTWACGCVQYKGDVGRTNWRLLSDVHCCTQCLHIPRPNPIRYGTLGMQPAYYTFRRSDTSQFMLFIAYI